MAFLILSALLLVASTTAWNTLGYLSRYSWFLEWSDVVTAFACVYFAVKVGSHLQQGLIYLLIAISLLLSILSYIPVLEANLPNTVNPANFYVYLLLIPAGIAIIISIGRKNIGLKTTSVIVLLSALAMVGFIAYSFHLVNPLFPTDESVFDLYAAHLLLSGMNPYNPALMASAFSYYPIFAPI